MPYSSRYKANRANGLSHVFTFSATYVHWKHCVKGDTQELQVVNGVTARGNLGYLTVKYYFTITVKILAR